MTAQRIFLALRALFFLVLFPGTVTLLVPWRLLSREGEWRVPVPTPLALLCGLAAGAGAAILLSSVWQFFAHGHGTLVPVDPPRTLVVTGLYRRTRNPMYNGVLLVLLGEAGLFRSVHLLGWAGMVLLLFHLFVVLYEEPALARRFGADYTEYRRAVPRWGFALRAYPRNS